MSPHPYAWSFLGGLFHLGVAMARCRVFYLDENRNVQKAMPLGAHLPEQAIAEAARMIDRASSMEVWCGAQVVARMKAAEARRLE